MNELENNSKIAYESPKIEIFLTQAQSVICGSPTESLNPTPGTWGSYEKEVPNTYGY